MWRSWLSGLLGIAACGGGGDDGGDDDTGDLITITAPNAPAAVIAYRDGDGAWTVAAASDAPITFQATAGRYTVVVGCKLQTGIAPRVTVYEYATADTHEIDHDLDCVVNPPAMLSGQVANNAAGSTITWGLTNFGRGANVTFSSYGLLIAPGTHDLVSLHGDGTLFDFDRAIVQRDLAITATTTIDLDFNASTAVALEPHTINSGGSVVTSALITANGTRAQITTGVTSNVIHVLPAALAAPGDRYVISGSTGGNAASGPVRLSSEQVITESVTDMSLDLPLETGLDPIVTTDFATKSISASWPGVDADAYTFNLFQSSVEWDMVFSRAYVVATQPVFEIPDLSMEAGWDPAFSLDNRTSVDWSLMARLGDVLLLPKQLPAAPATIRGHGWAHHAEF